MGYDIVRLSRGDEGTCREKGRFIGDCTGGRTSATGTCWLIGRGRRDEMMSRGGNDRRVEFEDLSYDFTESGVDLSRIFEVGGVLDCGRSIAC